MMMSTMNVIFSVIWNNSKGPWQCKLGIEVATMPKHFQAIP